MKFCKITYNRIRVVRHNALHYLWFDVWAIQKKSFKDKEKNDLKQSKQ